MSSRYAQAQPGLPLPGNDSWVCLNLVGMNPIRALFLSAVVNGVAAVSVMFLLMLVPEKPAIVGKFVLPRYLRVVGWVATGVMLVASLGFLVQQLLAR
jgi:Mn2+/Fe2+ NRAMP family transporter